MNYSAKIQLITGWTPQALKDWLDEGWVRDLTVKAGKWHGARVLNVIITGSTREDVEAKRKAFNAMIEAHGYGPDVLRKRLQEAKK